MTRELTAYTWVPPFAQGFVRDLRVRWALEEAGLPYEVRLIQPGEGKPADYLDRQPFGQVPAYRDGEVDMFESGAIVLHIATEAPALCPDDPAQMPAMTSWCFAALNSVEPQIGARNRYGSASEDLKAKLQKSLDRRLDALATALGEKDHLMGGFTAADILMTTVLREAEADARGRPGLDAYLDRCMDRPAFQTSLADQLRTIDENTPG